MSIFSRVSADLGDLKKLASVAHIGNGISIDAAKSLISKQLAAATGGITSQVSGAVAGATKIAGSVTSAASKISGAGLSSGVLPGPIKR